MAACRFALGVVACALSACATAGDGSSPPFGGSGDDDTASLSDASGGADDASVGDDSGGGGGGDDAGMNAATCPNDLTHQLEALGSVLVPPKVCTTSADCAPNQCCYIGTSTSGCIAQ